MEISQENLDPRYLRGVIDALELVSSFLQWKAEHPDSPRTTKEFLQKALEKLEQKTNQKLDEVLGLNIEE